MPQLTVQMIFMFQVYAHQLNTVRNLRYYEGAFLNMCPLIHMYTHLPGINGSVVTTGSVYVIDEIL